MKVKTSQRLQGLEVYLVGGAVRDHLLGRTAVDMDWVVVGATPDQMEGAGFKKVGADFPVFLCPDTGDEYALARTERKSGMGYNGFEIDASTSVTLRDDLMRRDLTINAMAMSLDGNLIDPFLGQDDLKDGVLRAVSLSFKEDPLRVLRVARFSARFPSFTINKVTMEMMQELSAGDELTHLTAERVWQEIDKSLGEDSPRRFFEVLQEAGALEKILPELAALNGVPQPTQHHPEVDTFLHVMMCLEQAVKLGCSASVRFAVLMHDLGKGITAVDELPSHIGHEKAGLPLVKAVCNRLKVPKRHKKLALAVCEHHLRCHKLLEMRPGTVFKLLKTLDGFRNPLIVSEFALACEADARGRAGLENREYPQRDLLTGALAVAKVISAKPLVEAGHTGLKLASLLDQERIRAISKFKA